MKQTKLRTLTGFPVFTLLVLLIAACGSEPESTTPRPGPADSGSFTFFEISKETRINTSQRKSLEKILEECKRRG